MQVGPLKAQKVIQAVFQAHSGVAEDRFRVTIPAGTTTLAIDKLSTHNTRQLTVAISVSAIPANVIVRKYFCAGQLFVDQTSALAVGANEISITTLHEDCEVYVQNNGIVDITVRATAIARP